MGARIVVLSAGFEPGYRGGGPIRSVVSLVDLYDGDGEVLVVTRDRDLGDHQPYPEVGGRLVSRSDRVKVFYFRVTSPRQWLALCRLLARRRVTLLQLNSFFSPQFSLLPLLAAKLRIIRADLVVVSPRGELMPGAMNIKSRKKRLLLPVWRRHLGRNVIVHVTSDLERTGVSQLLPSWPTLLVEQPSPTPAATPHQPVGSRLELCFVGRISPKKNLLTALQALTSTTADVHLSIFGPIEDNEYWAHCEQEIAKHSSPRASYCGEVSHQEVAAVFAKHDAFIFPTFGENHGHVIAESLSAGCPVILGAETPWTPVILDGGGWIVRTDDSSEMSHVIGDLASAPVETRLSYKTRALAAYERYRSMTPQRSLLNVALEALADRARCDS